MLENRAADWGNNVRIIGLSIDDCDEDVKAHVESKGWTKVEHYRCGEDSTAQKDFNIEGVPHCVLINTEGKIVWIGHPSERNLEADID
jgi:Thioredoxin-like